MPALLTRPAKVITENNLSIVLPSTEDQMAEIKARYEETGVVEDFARMTITEPVSDEPMPEAAPQDASAAAAGSGDASA